MFYADNEKEARHICFDGQRSIESLIKRSVRLLLETFTKDKVLIVQLIRHHMEMIIYRPNNYTQVFLVEVTGFDGDKREDEEGEVYHENELWQVKLHHMADHDSCWDCGVEKSVELACKAAVVNLGDENRRLSLWCDMKVCELGSLPDEVLDAMQNKLGYYTSQGDVREVELIMDRDAFCDLFPLFI